MGVENYSLFLYSIGIVFCCSDLPLNVESFTVSVHNKCKRTKDSEVGKYHINYMRQI